MDTDREEILSSLVRVGVVYSINPGKRLARVTFPDTGITSDWYHVLQHHKADIHVEPDNAHKHSLPEEPPYTSKTAEFPAHEHPGTHLTYWMPKVKESVLTITIPVDDGDGFILGGI